jgi:hypothetical protein
VLLARIEYELELARLAFEASHYVNVRDALGRAAALAAQLRETL